MNLRNEEIRILLELKKNGLLVEEDWEGNNDLRSVDDFDNFMGAHDFMGERNHEFDDVISNKLGRKYLPMLHRQLYQIISEGKEAISNYELNELMERNEEEYEESKSDQERMEAGEMDQDEREMYYDKNFDPDLDVSD